jgi:hypothetical protein
MNIQFEKFKNIIDGIIAEDAWDKLPTKALLALIHGVKRHSYFGVVEVPEKHIYHINKLCNERNIDDNESNFGLYGNNGSFSNYFFIQINKLKSYSVVSFDTVEQARNYVLNKARAQVNRAYGLNITAVGRMYKTTYAPSELHAMISEVVNDSLFWAN